MGHKVARIDLENGLMYSESNQPHQESLDHVDLPHDLPLNLALIEANSHKKEEQEDCDITSNDSQ